jgi:hypothetical protein
MAPLRSSTVKALGAILLLAFFGCDSPSAPKTGSLVLAIQGLPTGTDAAVTVTGPTGTSIPITKAETLSDLPPGNYTVTASLVTDKNDKYTVANSPLIATVTPGQSTVATVQYALVPPTLNLRIDGAYVTQSVQRYDGSVPLVAGRTGYLRIFAVANETNPVAPTVRLRLFSNGSLVSTKTLDPKTAGVPLSPDQGSTDKSWSVQIDGSLIQQGFGFVVDIDPDNVIHEANETDNSFPANGSPRALTVQAVPRLDVRFVPILTSINGLTGLVNDANKDSYLETALRMYPLSTYTTEVRAPFTTSAAVGPGADELATLNQVLNELDALRVAEGSTKYYAGILKLVQGSSFSGVGYIGQPTTVSYDLLPGAPVALAHEFGHTAGRHHAPCGNVANPDPNYPYAGASIGTYGFDVAAQTIYAPSTTFDLMSYCAPRWLSDYTYEGVMNFRNAAQLSAQIQSATDALIIWGRVENGRLILEPAFSARTAAALPQRGSYTAEGFDANGARLFSVSFEPTVVADALPGTKQFAFPVPIDAQAALQLAIIRVTGDGKAVQRVAVRDESFTSESSLATISPASPTKHTLRVSWAADRYPMAVVRDAESGEILGFARNGVATIESPTRRIEVVLSDGVRSVRASVRE